ncbi:MAG: hypothetical protein AAF547_15675 [Actinomycetota bacterium]
MTAIEPEEDLPPVAHVIMVYNGPVAPHWEMKPRYGDQKMLDEFWARVNARLLLLPKHDPQFRRNRERVNRDAERERIICDWDLGEGDAESTTTPVTVPASEVAAEAPAVTETEAVAVGAEAAEAEAVAEDPPVAEDVATEEAEVDEVATEEDPAEAPAGQG